MYYVGVDVHQRRSSVEILDQNGALYKRFQVFGRWPELIQRIDTEAPRPFAVCYEASCGYGYLHEQFSRMAHRVAVAHPGQLRLIYRSKKKHDRIDAAKIAKILYLDTVPEVHVPSMDIREWRALVEFRQRLVARHIAVKNQLQALLRGLAIVPVKGLWHRKGLQWLKELSLRDLDAVRRDLLLEELDQQYQKIQRLNRALAQIAARHPGITLLRTIPGVGVRTAEAVLAYVDDIRRFRRVGQVASYFGLIPCQDASAAKNRLGHITKDGPDTARKLLVEASWMAVRRSPTIRQLFDRFVQEKPGRRKIAIVAVAHHLIRVMTAMLRTGEVWRESPLMTTGRHGTPIRPT